MTLRLADLTPAAVEDAAAYWLYAEDGGWECWRLVPGSPTIAPGGRVLRLAFELEGDSFELALIQRDAHWLVKYDDHEDPGQELPARVYESDDEVIVGFLHGDQRIFVQLELAL